MTCGPEEQRAGHQSVESQLYESEHVDEAADQDSPMSIKLQPVYWLQ